MLESSPSSSCRRTAVAVASFSTSAAVAIAGPPSLRLLGNGPQRLASFAGDHLEGEGEPRHLPRVAFRPRRHGHHRRRRVCLCLCACARVCCQGLHLGLQLCAPLCCCRHRASFRCKALELPCLLRTSSLGHSGGRLGCLCTHARGGQQLLATLQLPLGLPLSTTRCFQCGLKRNLALSASAACSLFCSLVLRCLVLQRLVLSRHL
mmetsp:Transcript_1060/g.2274  ORF Transcript_1060/g.2274 Transcript_1060/m.2274 type:complete len:206 (-) Transcript_1060:747-1364(-)